ncbi:MAG TPA: cytochrome P450 [Byssovorax sp.]
MDARILRAVDRADALAQTLLTPQPAREPALRVPPGPPRRPGRLFGSLGYYLGFMTDPIGFVAKRFEQYGDLYYAPGPDGHLYGVRHPDHLVEVLVTRAAQFDKTHSAFKQLSELLGDGLLNSDGDRWRRRRRMIQPAFERARLAGYSSAMVDEAVGAAGAIVDGELRDVGHDMMRLTLRVVSRALFSHDVDPAAIVTVANAMESFKARAESADMAMPWLPTPGRARARRAVEALDDMMYALVDARRASKDSPPDPPDLLHMLVTAIDLEGDGAGLSRKEVRDELVTMFLAGHETTANALTWTLYFLAKHPDVRATLEAEVDAALGGRAPTLADLERMPFGEQVIKESMRLRPPVFIVARRAREDTTIGGYPIPKGSEVVLWTYLTHHDARWFPEPEAFRPSRFAPEAEAKLPKLAFVPFGAGPRACIGKMFAMIEARLLLATLVQRVRFELPAGAPDVQVSPKITLGPKGGVHLTARSR